MAEYTPEQQAGVVRMVRLAFTGDPKMTWLTEAIREAGYRPGFLVTIHELMRGFDVSNKTIYTWRNDGMPVTRESHSRNPALYDLFEVCKWRVKWTEGRVRAKMDEDPLLSGESSAALEKYRREKYREAKRNNDLAEGLLCTTAHVEQGIAAGASVLRQKSDMAQRTFGREAGAFMAGVIDEFIQAVEAVAKKPGATKPAPTKRGRGRPKKGA